MSTALAYIRQSRFGSWLHNPPVAPHRTDSVALCFAIALINTGQMQKHGVGKLVLAGTPSTRFDGNDIDGLSEDQLKYPKKFLQLYAESKAKGEQAILAACCDELLTISIAPHQHSHAVVYNMHEAVASPDCTLTVASRCLGVISAYAHLHMLTTTVMA
eukprot:19543-Heterococcus_DN1.PRE.2